MQAGAQNRLKDIDPGWASYTGWQREYFIYETFNLLGDEGKVAQVFGSGALAEPIKEEWRGHLLYLRGMWIEDQAHLLGAYWLRKMSEVDKDGKPIVQFQDKLIRALKLLSELRVTKTAEEPPEKAQGGSMDDVRKLRDEITEDEGDEQAA